MAWLIVSWLQLLLVSEGVAMALCTGFALPVNAAALYGGIALFSAAAAAFFAADRLTGYRRYFLMAWVIGYALSLFLTQQRVTDGALELANAVLSAINSRYEGALTLLPAGGGEGLTVFLLEVFAALVLWLGAIVVDRADALQLDLLLLPFVTLLLLCGGAPSELPLFLLLFGVVSLLASARSVRRKRLWGERDSESYRNNLAIHRSIRRKTAVLLCAAGIVLSVPGFYAVRPFLQAQLAPAEQAFSVAEGRALGALVTLLPQMSGGAWNLQVTAAGGGVSDGLLTEAEGYALQGVEDLKVTCTARPEETVYLRGFVGSLYTGDRWLPPSGERFRQAAANWRTEGEDSLYVHNLPFLRRLYAEQDGEASALQQMTVERLNANAAYTYVPYYAFLNDYYEVPDGDGGVTGQEEQEDVFPFFFRADYQSGIRTWNEDEERISVLDRIEASYSAYVTAADLTVPAGFADLQRRCEEQGLKSEDTDAIREDIRTYLAQSYAYSMDAPPTPEGEDFVRYFLDTSKTGYSVHFASAATLMFRMYGVPARYVVGYAAPRNLFTAQPDGNYTAVLQDDNAHAWTEIYIAGEGWTPVEMTPGAVGTARDIAYVGDEIPVAPTEQPEETTAPHAPEETPEETPSRPLPGAALEQVIWLAAALLAVLLALAAAVRGLLRYRRDNGLDRRKSPRQRIVEVFQAYYRALIRRGMPADTDSASPAFLRWAARLNPSLGKEGAAALVRLAQESCYSPEPPDEGDVRWTQSAYRSLKRERRSGKQKA